MFTPRYPNASSKGVLLTSTSSQRQEEAIILNAPVYDTKEAEGERNVDWRQNQNVGSWRRKSLRFANVGKGIAIHLGTDKKVERLMEREEGQMVLCF